jgi:hypothetical protein
MTYSTIYELNGYPITDGVQSQKVCDATINTARALAASRSETVVVEDRGTEECYVVTPKGEIEAAPDGWTPDWELEEDDWS